MATTKFSGNPVSLKGELITVGVKAPDFQLVKSDLSNFSLKDAAGKFLVLNIFPSLDTSVCATSVRKFNQYAAALPNTLVLAISMDLPFAQKRFCTAEGIENVIPLSAFRSDFGKAYGLQISDSVFEGLLARAVVIVNPEGKVSYVELVPEITTEPNYEAALSSIKK